MSPQAGPAWVLDTWTPLPGCPPSSLAPSHGYSAETWPVFKLQLSRTLAVRPKTACLRAGVSTPALVAG